MRLENRLSLPKVRNVAIVLVGREALYRFVGNVVVRPADAGVLATRLRRVQLRQQTEGGLAIAHVPTPKDGLQRVIALIHVRRNKRRCHDPAESGNGGQEQKRKQNDGFCKLGCQFCSQGALSPFSGPKHQILREKKTPKGGFRMLAESQ